MRTCVDLEALFGDQYRLRKEADGVTWFETPEHERPWLLELACRYGIVYPHGGDVLAVTVTSRRIGRQVSTLPCIVSRRGEVELVVTFHVGDAEQVLALLRPYRAHVMTEARRQALAAARARSSLQLGGDGAGARGGEVETGVRIDAPGLHDVRSTLNERAARNPMETSGREE
jgi:hypothetical protein